MRTRPFLLASFLLGTATPLSSQVLKGSLLDASTGGPIAGAHVSLRTADGDLVRATVSGVDGTFRLSAPRAGDYHVHAGRIGYFGFLEGPIALAEGDIVEVRFELSPQPISLDPIAVTTAARVRRLENSGFYRRKQAGFGHFLERADIEARRPQQLSDPLRALPGVRLVPSSGGGYRVLMRGAAQESLIGRACLPRIYLDGIPTQEEPDGVVDPLALEAVEIYRGPAETPAQYSGVGNACGVILLWSRL